ncbi:MAG: amino acid ABC transporter substrate-binding protein [Pseudomonadales bacterium]|nr:amino acid ABC transporter substrate-binding protein [Pseudomonadales bacterium]
MAFVIPCVCANDEDDKTLRVGVLNIPPFWIIEDQHFSGAEIDIIKALVQPFGWKVEFVECPWKRCLLMMETGEIDLLSSLSKTAERSKKLSYIEPPYYSTSIAFYMHKAATFEINTYEDLKALNIGVLDGALYFEPFDSDDKLQKHFVTYEKQIFDMLKRQRIDITLGDEVSLDQFLQKHALYEEYRKASYRVKSEDGYIALSKKSAFMHQRDKIAEVLARLVKSGQIKDLYNKHHIPWQPPTQTPQE